MVVHMQQHATMNGIDGWVDGWIGTMDTDTKKKNEFCTRENLDGTPLGCESPIFLGKFIYRQYYTQNKHKKKLQERRDGNGRLPT
mmetsp:Transcript_36687/g.88981  ORF Transcript_36687/g.88981 Transcript_36687/m.88981 type:complete len:85 (+) Transcript_36687:1173-1427(+)